MHSFWYPDVLLTEATKDGGTSLGLDRGPTGVKSVPQHVIPGLFKVWSHFRGVQIRASSRIRELGCLALKLHAVQYSTPQEVGQRQTHLYILTSQCSEV